jgi:uncharacterized 2Fe-2S/4Fe-4S cluster protein (DUF4445 family)
MYRLGENSKYGVSIDLGTSRITMHLVNVLNGKVLDSEAFPNPQMEFGLDVISRIDFYRKSSSNAEVMTNSVRTAVSDGIQNMLSRSGVVQSSVGIIVIVGNTVMHHLFYGLSTDSLLSPPFKASAKEVISIPAHEVGLPVNEAAICFSPPIVDSFIGPDAIMLLLVSGALDSTENLVAIDVGTNTEIAVKSEGGLWMASAASGPAFEGMSLACGMPAELGAISVVEIGNDYIPTVQVIGGGRAKGICGSGAISAMASLLDAGLLNTKGSLRRDVSSDWWVVGSSGPRLILADAFTSESKRPIFFSQADVRMLQQSKAAISGAVRLLLRKAQCSSADVSRFFLTGAFGTALNLDGAYQIGLFPSFQNAEVLQVQGGAIQGADMLVTDPELRLSTEKVPERVSYIELTDNPEFQEYYLKSQHFIPMTD